MIVRTQTIRFSPDRAPMPRRLKIGFEGDNMVERLEFKLPDIAGNQTANLMIDGEYANMIMLTPSAEDDRYYCDLTAERIGTAGDTECYVVIDGENGEVWQSDVIVLRVGEVPGVNEELERLYPDAISQMRQEMARHNAAMYDQEERIGAAAREAETQAAAAQDAAITARIQAGRAEEAAKRAEGLITIGAEYAGMLLIVGADGRAAPIRIGAGLAIVDGALVVTAAPGGSDVRFEVLDDGSIRLAGVEFVGLGDGVVLLDGAEFYQQEDGSVLIR